MKENKSKIKDESEDDNSFFGIFAVLIVLIIIGLWLATLLILNKWTNEDKSSFGDMFGSINALFSGLALAGIIMTMLLQRKELALQRSELRYTREELKRSADAQENSERALIRQAENLKISAKLTALDTLVKFYSDFEVQSRMGRGVAFTSEMKDKRNRYLRRIEEILEQKETIN